jgi:hypothetical protein
MGSARLRFAYSFSAGQVPCVSARHCWTGPLHKTSTSALNSTRSPQSAVSNRFATELPPSAATSAAATANPPAAAPPERLRRHIDTHPPARRALNCTIKSRIHNTPTTPRVSCAPSAGHHPDQHAPHTDLVCVYVCVCVCIHVRICVSPVSIA